MYKQEQQTDIYSKYERCKRYMDKKKLVENTEKNWNFYIGEHWKGLKTDKSNAKPPSINFIKQIVQWKVSTIAQNSMTAVYSDIQGRPELSDIYDRLNNFWAMCWERSQMDTIKWKVLKSAAIQGDAYVYWADGDTTKKPQILDNTNVFLADENNDDIQNQDFIIVRERWSVKAARKVAKENGVPEDEIARIMADSDNNNQLMNKFEVEDKVTVLFYVEKDENGVVRTGRATQGVIIEPVEPITSVNADGTPIQGLKSYPIIPFVWEEVPNNARGISEITQLLPNQIEYNKTLARRSAAVNIGAYPRLAYDANAIDNPEDLDKVGVAIAVNGGGAQSIQQMISYLNATNISSDADKLSNDLLQTTKDVAGANDYAMGNVNPEQASGQAITAVRDQTQVALNEQVARYKQWVEDVSMLWLDLWIAYNPKGIDFQMEQDGQQIPAHIGQEELEQLKPMVRIDVSKDNEWTKLSEQQTIDNLLNSQQISLDEFVEIAPDNSSVPKAKLKAVLEKRQPQPMEQENNDIDLDLVRSELQNQGVPAEDIEGMLNQM